MAQADCELLQALLEIFEPLLLHVEINPLFPPPYAPRAQPVGSSYFIGGDVSSVAFWT